MERSWGEKNCELEIMSAFLPFFISFLIGFLLINFLVGKKAPKDFWLIFFLAVGLGLGISGLLTFFLILLFNGYDRTSIFLAHFYLLAILLIIQRKNKFQILLPEFHLNSSVPFLFFAAASIGIYFAAQNHPFGEWDSWALWNLKAKFIVLSSDWRDVFRLHWHTQPDYPLLLPLINIWGWSFSRGDFFAVSLLTSVIFTISCAGVLFAALSRYTSEKLALLISLFLVSFPPYLFLGTSQYADIVLSYYLLSSCVLLVLSIRDNNEDFTLLCGIFIGFMPFAKNEGIILSLLFLIIASLSCLGRKKILAIYLGILISLPVTVIFKIFLAPTNRDIFFNPASLQFFNFEGCYVVLANFLQNIFSAAWREVSLVILVGAIIARKGLLRKEVKLLLIFLLSYSMVVFFVYLTTAHFSLTWRLSRTISRILFYLLPSALFIIFYTLFQGDKKENPS